ncbi:hypothetical protein [Pseudonocardia endophytica]|uniref:Uncharacterized protein n=1 Tax=Pseudonocardia endophytica TaxID=401976 RepID=A0A4R1HSF7_PSEEN|nr:hypothetical protein [Pseudonocardia endophytica]TCK22779.1 hypothetical protein EV378_6789 [Pseudonocardia endophytica]
MWRSGWLGIDAYGQDTHGFANLDTDRDGAVEAEIHWLAETGDVHTSFRLRYAPDVGVVELLANFAAEHEPGEDDDADASGWSIEDTTAVPATLMPYLSAGVSPEHMFTALASLHSEMFSVLEDAHGLGWDHHWLPGPGPDELWQPADLGTGAGPFAVRS